MQITPLPLLSDNYAWLLTCDGSSECAVVDPSETRPVMAALQGRGLQLRWILATHHHADHTGGITGLVQANAGVEVIASEYDKGRIPAVTRTVGDGSHFTVLGSEVQCMMVPGHTLGAVAFYIADAQAVFTGDTLFTAGCGRLFEGDAAQMHASLGKLRGLPPATQVYCGHEYTEKNLRFALSLEPKSAAIAARLQEVKLLRAKDRPTVPASLQVEQATNPFLRADDPELASRVGKPAGVALLAELRERRDHF